MSSLNDSSSQYFHVKQNLIKGLVRSAILGIQNHFKLFPHKVCLISGAPRSGTTALCEWLSCQPGVSAFSESRILVGINSLIDEIYEFRNLEHDSAMIMRLARQLVFDYYSGSRILIGKKLIIDKEPLEPIAFPEKEYERFILNIKRLLPESKLLLVIRDPVATIWSMSQRTWGASRTNDEIRRFTLEQYIENWCSCAELISQQCSNSHTYVVQFGCLINDSVNESNRIFDYLNIRNGVVFQPRRTNEIGFSKEDQKRILLRVEPQLALLDSKGISNL